MTDPYEGVERVQKRPGMYVGPTDDGTGLHNMVYGIVGNAINEALTGHATSITVRLNRDGSCTVRDDGRGLPTDIHPRFGISVAEVAMTNLHAGIGEHPASGLHGVGVCAVNALSDWLDLRIWRDGKEYGMRFHAGKADAPIAVLGDAGERHGTEVTFLPSAKFFTETKFDQERLRARIRELASQHSISIAFSCVE